MESMQDFLYLYEENAHRTSLTLVIADFDENLYFYKHVYCFRGLDLTPIWSVWDEEYSLSLMFIFIVSP